MSYLASTTTTVDADTSAEVSMRRQPTELRASFEPPQRTRTEFTYPRRVLPLEGGRLLLHLYDSPVVAVDHNQHADQLECEVLGWGIRMKSQAVEHIDQLMARRFLDLFSKADAGRLSEQDEADWMSIVERVDYAAFCADRAAPQYMEGQLLRHQPKCRVEWHDGTVENLKPEAARALRVLQEGDHFGAYVKMDREGQAKSLERLTLLPNADA